jgi:ribosome-binding protein aMBF1 (putative translation factor)
LPIPFFKAACNFFPSQKPVALLGFAYRHISVKFTQKTRKQAATKPLLTKVKTIADWIRAKLCDNGMSPFHVGAKMGIATSVVNAWKDGLARPQNRQMREMVTILGTYRHGRSDVIAVGLS